MPCIPRPRDPDGPAPPWPAPPEVTPPGGPPRLSPPDLYRQIDKHRRAYAEGVNAPFADSDANRHAQNPDGSGYLTRAALNAVDSAILAIRGHQPFDEIDRQLGVVSHFVSDATNPLAVSPDDSDH